MHSVTWISAAGSVRSISTPNSATAWQIYTLLRVLHIKARLWLHTAKAAPMLLA